MPEDHRSAVPARVSRGLLLMLNSQRHALALRHVRRLLPMATMTPLPLAPAALAGLLDLHGQAWPVIDLQILFGGAATAPTLRTRIALLASRSTDAAGCPACALLLGGTGEVVALPAAAGVEVKPAAAASDPAWTLGVDRAGRLLWLDLPTVLRRHVQPLLRALARELTDPEPAHASP